MSRLLGRIPNRETQFSPDFASGSTGPERMAKLVELERIRREMHNVVLESVSNVRADVPPAAQGWVYDLRRGRMSVGGGVLRFVEILARGPLGRPHARILAMRLVGLICDYIEIVLPYRPSTEPEKMPAHLSASGQHFVIARSRGVA